MIVNRQTLLNAAPIKGMLSHKENAFGVSYGLSEAGYDIRIKQSVMFEPVLISANTFRSRTVDGECITENQGRFIIASAIEEFQMPNFLVGIVHDKSTWARRGLSVFNTVIEPGWKGFLTLELVYHGSKPLYIEAGSGIAQVVFHGTTDIAEYKGKYQNQPDAPIPAMKS
jgi:dCTP deaminase